MELKQAERIAADACDVICPFVERIAIAGSVRRRKPEVHDIELVVIPKFESEPAGLFADLNFPDDPPRQVNSLSVHIREVITGRFVKDGDRMKQIALPQGINLELYIVLPPAQWGAIYTIRTGCADFSHWLVTPRKHGGAMPSWMCEKHGGLYADDRLIETPEEIDFFDRLRVEWIRPQERTGARMDKLR